MTAQGFDDDQTRSFIPLTAGTKVAHYEIISKIGAGGMGEVYLANDTKLDRKVALKFLSVHLSQDETSRARFTREAKAAAKLDHPNIVPVHEVGEYQGRPFFAMAHIEGQSLRDVIRQGKLTVSGALDLCMQICEGLNEAHNAGIVHRDIKPGNIIIDTKNKPRIVDFGLATISGEEKLTKTGSTLGTVGYMSPEQVRGDKVDRRSDLFSIGVVLYELLSGMNPFKADSEAATTHAITQVNPQPLARFNRDVPEELQRIVDKALTKDVSLRYQHADGMLSDLKRLKTDSGQPVTSRIGLWIAAAVVVLAAGYFVYDQYFRTDSATEEGWTNSIAVLPLRDFSSGKDQEFFSDGMTYAIIGKLSGIKNLKVISMTSVMRYKDQDRDLKKIGHDLQVKHILEGSVQIDGDKIRVRTQLIKVADDAHLWSETYDRQLESVFDIQDDISQALVDAMRIELREKGTKSISSRHTKNIEAFNSYIQGRFLWNKRTEADIRQAITHFEKAIEFDPNYALAYSGLADAWSVIRGYADVPGSINEAEVLKKSKEAAEMAIKLDKNLAEAHASMGLVLDSENNNEGAEKEFLRAIELNPGYHWAHFWYSSLLKEMAMYQKVLEEEEIAFQLNPMSIPLISRRARAKEWSLNFDEAEKLYRRLIEIEPNRMVAYINLGSFLVNIGRNDEAILQAKKAVEIDNYAYTSLAYLYSQVGEFDKAIWAANKCLELIQEKHDAYDSRGEIFALNGMLDSAIVCFSNALEIDPDYAVSIMKMGNVYMFMQEYGKADSLYTILASHKDQFWRDQGRLRLAQLPLHQGKFKSALALLNKLKTEAISDLINDERLVVGIFKRGTTYQEILGMHDAAVAEYEKAINILKDITPNSNLLHSSRALIGYSDALRGDFEKADKYIQELKVGIDKYGPTANSDLWFHSGRVEAAKENFDIAITNFENLVMLTQAFTNIQILASIYLRAGRIDDAIILYEKIIDRYDPWNRADWPTWSVIIHYNLGKTYQAAGRYDDAIKQYETFLDIWRDADEGIEIIEDAKERLAKLRAG
ncbi:MAG: protein kinase [candidate division Zixibacteria bacterium]|nr:protein kinase [candidate division Zixibacteria bacterium]